MIPFKIKIMEKLHMLLLLARPLNFKLQQEVLISNGICVSWSSPKTDLEANFINLENRSFEDVFFSKECLSLNIH